MEKETLGHLELYKCLPMILLLDKYNYITEIYRHAKLSYAIIYKRIEFLRQENIIYTEKVGRKLIYRFTTKGYLILTLLIKLNELIDK